MLTALNANPRPELAVFEDGESLDSRFAGFTLSDGYLWLGAAAAFALVALAALVRRLPAWMLAPALIVSALVAFLNRDSDLGDLGIEGAYFNRSVDGSGFVSVLADSIFEPFNLTDGVMWAGAAAAFAVSGLFALTARPRRP